MLRVVQKIVILLIVIADIALLPAGIVLAQSSTNTGTSSSAATTNTNTTNPPPKSIADNVCLGVLFTEPAVVNQNNVTVSSCEQSGDSDFGFLIRRIINIFTIVVGAVSVIMIIIGGFRYIISGGDSSGVSGAKNTILYAIVGLVVVLFAQIIIRFVLTNITPGAK